MVLYMFVGFVTVNTCINV